MQYPSNFPKQNEQQLLNILLTIQSSNIKIASKQQFVSEVQQVLKKQFSTVFNCFNLSLSNHRFPSFWHFRFILERHQARFKPSFIKQLKLVLVKTRVRSWSGIVPVSVFTKGVGCSFNCVYCPSEPGMPKSYLSDEPAVRRAIRFHFDPFEQTFGRLQMLYLSGHPLDKIELIIQGGTFSFYNNKYREWFVKRCYDAANTSVATSLRYGTLKRSLGKDLLTSQKTNEKAEQRIIGLTIETRPDYINVKEIKYLRKLGVTRVEVGVQAPDDKLLEKVKRGHGTKEITQATKLLKETGFKITYHLMPGLPGSSVNKDLQMLAEIFENPAYKPDNIKFYPTSVVKYSKLAKWYKQGKYKPYDEQTLSQLITKFKQEIVPEWVRIQRLVRDLTTNDVLVEAFPSNLRQIVHQKSGSKKVICSCIRCREIKTSPKQKKLKLKQLVYDANEGKEYFLQYVDQNNRLYALLRLRIPANSINKQKLPLIALKNCALVRELHVYGEALKIGEKSRAKTQHQGLGGKLLKEAEVITKKHKIQKLAIIAGVGTREYYHKLGYQLQKTYMIKSLQ